MSLGAGILGQSRASVVVEIGADLLKIFKMRESRGRMRHQLLKIVRIADLKQPLEEELPPLFKSMGIGSQSAATYLPRKLVTMRFLEVPSTDPKELEDMMRLQGIKQTPYSPDEVALAYTVVGSRPDGMSEVVLAFCQRKFVDERVNLLKMSGLKVHRVGVSTEGVVDWYLKNQPGKKGAASADPVILIDCDLSFSDVIFLRNEKFFYSKSVLAGGQQVVMDAEKGVANFCQEVKLTVDFALEETRLPLPRKGFLIAPVSEKDPLRSALESRLGFPIEVLNPGRGLDLPVTSKKKARGSVTLIPYDVDRAADTLVNRASVTPLIGFGRKKGDLLFDLLPEDLKLAFGLEQRSVQMLTTGILSLGLLAVIAFFVAGNFYKKKEYLETLQKEITKSQEAAFGIEEKLARTRLIEKVKNPDGTFLAYLRKISGVLPPEVYFNSVEFISEKEVVLKGNARQMSDVFDFAKALEEMKVFKGVKSDRVSKKKEGDQTLAEFEINCLL